ncbi:MAG: hypothetical protein ACFE8V_14485 [Promethearchaeota archaeon]
MIFQEFEIFRIATVITVQSFVLILFFYLAFKILKRKIDITTVTLSLFYIIIGFGLILSSLFLLIRTTFMGLVIYIIGAYLILFGQIFLVVFIYNILKLSKSLKSLKQISVIIVYGLITALIIVFFPEGISITSETNYAPKYSWFFLITLYSMFTGTIVVPSLVLFRRLFKLFEDRDLRKKLKFFFIGVIGFFLSFYGLILYNTWHDPLFRLIWAFASFIVLPSGYLIYYGIGRGL